MAETLTRSPDRASPIPLAIEIARQMTAGAGNGDVEQADGARRRRDARDRARQADQRRRRSTAQARHRRWNPAIAKLLKEHSGL
jgi:hypothetical protein